MPELKSLTELIEEYANELEDVSFELDKVALLKTLALIESSYGKNNKPKFESAYYIGGKLYKNSPTLRKQIAVYGRDAACSWSSFQIMYINAYDTGYRGLPKNLRSDEIAIPYIIKFINVRIIRLKPRKIEDIFDAYNSGSFKDSYVPVTYIRKAMSAYKYYLGH